MPALSIIIVNYKNPQLAIDCLKTIYEQTQNIDFEVIVVDNASEDSSVEMVRNSFSQVRLIANQQNVGLAHERCFEMMQIRVG